MISDKISDAIGDCLADNIAGGATVLGTLGDSARLWFSAFNAATDYTLGVSPDVAAVVNKAVSGLSDLNSPSEAQRLHIGTVGGLPAFEYSAAESKHVRSASPGDDILTASDSDVDIWFVGAFAGINNQTLLDMTNAWVTNRGITLYVNGSSLTARIYAGGSAQVESADWFPNEDNHLFRVRYASSNLELFVDEVSLGDTACGASLDNDLDRIALGSLGYGDWYLNGSARELVVARNADADQRAAITSILATRWEISV